MQHNTSLTQRQKAHADLCTKIHQFASENRKQAHIHEVLKSQHPKWLARHNKWAWSTSDAAFGKMILGLVISAIVGGVGAAIGFAWMICLPMIFFVGIILITFHEEKIVKANPLETIPFEVMEQDTLPSLVEIMDLVNTFTDDTDLRKYLFTRLEAYYSHMTQNETYVPTKVREDETKHFRHILDQALNYPMMNADEKAEFLGRETLQKQLV